MWIDLNKIIYIKDPQGQCDLYASHFQIGTVSAPITIGVGDGQANKGPGSNVMRVDSVLEINAVHKKLLEAWSKK